MNVGIVDMGFGLAEIYGNVACHEPMQQISMELILQEWDAGDYDWYDVGRRKLIWHSKKSGRTREPDMVFALFRYRITNLKAGSIYRVKGIFAVHQGEKGKYEVMQTYTEGLEFR